MAVENVQTYASIVTTIPNKAIDCDQDTMPRIDGVILKTSLWAIDAIVIQKEYLKISFKMPRLVP